MSNVFAIRPSSPIALPNVESLPPRRSRPRGEYQHLLSVCCSQGTRCWDYCAQGGGGDRWGMVRRPDGLVGRLSRWAKAGP